METNCFLYNTYKYTESKVVNKQAAETRKYWNHFNWNNKILLKTTFYNMFLYQGNIWNVYVNVSG